jgi:molybdenum cofactor cytidylyltransferase
MIGTVLLAAGPSTRFGGIAKQLLTINGTTLVRLAAETAIVANPKGPNVVVLGNRRQQIAPEFDGLPLTLVDNLAWETGMASSLKTGLAGLYLMERNLDAVVVLYADQPLVSPAVIKHLIATFTETGRTLVACQANGRLIIPALFGRKYMDELLNLTGDKGAHWILSRHRANCIAVPFEDAAINLDNRTDLDRFVTAQNGTKN